MKKPVDSDADQLSDTKHIDQLIKPFGHLSSVWLGF
jgi:hypothetical protein